MSGAQITATAAWLSVLAVPWFLALGGKAEAAVPVLLVSAAVGLLAGAYHQGQVLRRARVAADLAARMKTAARASSPVWPWGPDTAAPDPDPSPSPSRRGS